ncbi:MAG: ExbD/TolR family protein [Burkholderiaceae bacterium]|jgi:biopolymer transport protein TolR
MSNISSMRGGRSRKFKSEINVVPYIDVMLVLLVIFMVVAPLSTPSMINLPKAGKSNQPPTEYLEIELKPDGSATVGVHGKKTVSTKKREELGNRLEELHEKYPDLPLMISADKDIKYDEVVQTISQANKTGIARVGLSTR